MEEKSLVCRHVTHNKPCAKEATHTVHFFNHETKIVCARHVNTCKKAGNVSHVVKEKKRAKLIIDETSNKATQCCVRPKENDPLCWRRPIYAIENKYFCGQHARKHPHGYDGRVVIWNQSDRVMDFYETTQKNLAELNKNVDRIKGWFEHLIGMDEFRKFVYEIADTQKLT